MLLDLSNNTFSRSMDTLGLAQYIMVNWTHGETYAKLKNGNRFIFFIFLFDTICPKYFKIWGNTAQLTRVCTTIWSFDVLSEYFYEGKKTFDKLCRRNENFRSVVYLKFQFNRTVGFYILQLYIPLTIIVMSSWVSFWLVKFRQNQFRVANFSRNFSFLLWFLFMLCAKWDLDTPSCTVSVRPRKWRPILKPRSNAAMCLYQAITYTAGQKVFQIVKVFLLKRTDCMAWRDSIALNPRRSIDWSAKLQTRCRLCDGKRKTLDRHKQHTPRCVGGWRGGRGRAIQFSKILSDFCSRGLNHLLLHLKGPGRSIRALS